MVINITNGVLLFDPATPTYAVGTSLTYSCNMGFQFAGNLVTTCNSSFIWSLDQSPPVCSNGKIFLILIQCLASNNKCKVNTKFNIFYDFPQK